MDYVLKKSRSDTDAKTGENLEKPLLTFRNSGTSISDFPKGSTKLPLEKSPLFRVATLVVNDQKPIGKGCFERLFFLGRSGVLNDRLLGFKPRNER
jgi:hypothetical protein